MKKIIMAAVLMVFIPVLGLAADKPSSKEAKRVMDYYNSGKGTGAILVDCKFCTEMGKDEETKNDCSLVPPENEFKVNAEIYLWMNFMIPVDDNARILLAYSRNSRIRKTQEITLSSAFRYRTWKKIATEKPGQWTIQISQELGEADIDLGSFVYNVIE